MKRLLLSAFLILCVFGAKALEDLRRTPSLLDNIHHRLAECPTSQDSIIPLTNLFDITQATQSEQQTDSLAELTYQVACRAKDTSVALDMLRQRANMNLKYPDTLRMLLNRARSFPESVRAKETDAYIRMRINTYISIYAPEDSIQSMFSRQIKQAEKSQKDIYEHIVLLHAICQNIAREANGQLLVQYMDRLGELVDQLPAEIYSIRNHYLVTSARVYRDVNKPELSLEADRKLLKNIDELSNYYEHVGRPYRNYDASRYNIYVRMLSNWNSLSAEEANDIYKKALRCVETDPRARNTYELIPMPDIFIAMINKDYRTARDKILPVLSQPLNEGQRKRLLRDLLTASEALGDDATSSKAATEYASMLEKTITNKAFERLRELQMIYLVSDMKRNMEELRTDKQETEGKLQRTVVGASIISIIALLILVFFLVRLYRHSKRLATSLSASNEALKKESISLHKSQKELMAMRDEAQKANQFKTDFIRSMSHEIAVPLNSLIEHSHLIVDCADASNKPYLEKYAELIDANGEFLTTIVNDVLHLSEIDNNTMSLNRQLVDLRKLTELVVESVSGKLKPGVEVVFDSNSRNLDTFTDPSRVQQVLLNLLDNAVKFTNTGRIFLECHLVNGGKTVAIMVSDTGIGISPEQKEFIFKRFSKINKDSQGAGLGLAVARMIARLLGGDLVLDTTYNHGARFIFTLPYKIK